MNRTMTQKRNRRNSQAGEHNGGPKKDAHRDKKMFRIPDRYHALFKALAEKNDRPMSREVLRALREHLRANGLSVPEEGGAEEAG